MKKLLLLAGAGVHCKVVEAAQEMGIYTIVTDYLPNSPAKEIADESLMNNIFDVDELAEYGKAHHIDGVLGLCIDPAQKPAQQIAKRLGLPTFGDDDQVLALTNKTVFKKLCMDNGVDVIPTYSDNDVWTKELPYPILVKPVDSRGSRGISVCNNRDEVIAAIAIARTQSSNGEVIIEKYMASNQDLTISYIVKNGEPHLISIGDRYPGRVEDNLNRQLICTIQPSRYASMYMEKVDNRVKGMIKALGIQNGPVFMQGFVDGDTVCMYDPGIRFPGNEYERILRKATGINVMKSIISYAVGGEIDDFGGKLDGCYDLNGKVAMQYMINVGAGKIGRFDGLDQISKLPFVVDVQQRHFVGEVVEETGDIRHRAGEVSILIDRNLAAMKNAVKQVQSLLSVEDKNGSNMLISQFKPEIVDAYYGGIWHE